MGRRKWSGLDERVRRLLIAGAIAEGCLKIAAVVDVARRPASRIRGRKFLWIPLLAGVNSLGAVPIAYFPFGRRRR